MRQERKHGNWWLAASGWRMEADQKCGELVARVGGPGKEWGLL